MFILFCVVFDENRHHQSPQSSGVYTMFRIVLKLHWIACGGHNRLYVDAGEPIGVFG